MQNKGKQSHNYYILHLLGTCYVPGPLRSFKLNNGPEIEIIIIP